MNKKIVYFIVVIVFIVIGFFAFNKFLKNEREVSVENISINNIIVPDQAPGNEIFVEEVLLEAKEAGGFVIFYRINEDNSEGDMIGNSRYLSPGFTKNFLVPLYKGETAEIGETILAVLHSDNGDSVWDYEKDLATKDIEGNIIKVTFKIIDNLEDLPGFDSKQ